MLGANEIPVCVCGCVTVCGVWWCGCVLVCITVWGGSCCVIACMHDGMTAVCVVVVRAARVCRRWCVCDMVVVVVVVAVVVVVVVVVIVWWCASPKSRATNAMQCSSWCRLSLLL